MSNEPVDHGFHNLRLSASAGVSTIVLDRPDTINAFTAEMYREIRRAIRIADQDPDTSVIVLAAEGAVFGVGGDLGEMLELLEDPRPGGPVHHYQDDLPFDAVRDCRKPTIAAVRGTCVGGGFGLANACDLIVAAEGTRFGIPESKVGLIDGLAVAALHGHVPLPTLKYLLFTGALFDAVEALRLGLILEVVPSSELEERVLSIAQQLQASSPRAISEYKRIFRSYDRPDHVSVVIDMLVRDPDVATGLREFFERRRGPSS